MKLHCVFESIMDGESFSNKEYEDNQSKAIHIQTKIKFLEKRYNQLCTILADIKWRFCKQYRVVYNKSYAHPLLRVEPEPHKNPAWQTPEGIEYINTITPVISKINKIATSVNPLIRRFPNGRVIYKVHEPLNPYTY